MSEAAANKILLEAFKKKIIFYNKIVTISTKEWMT